MKRLLALLAGAVLAAAGCSTLSISTDFDQDRRLSRSTRRSRGRNGRRDRLDLEQADPGVFTDTLAAKGLKRGRLGWGPLGRGPPAPLEGNADQHVQHGLGYGYGWYGYGGMGMATTTVTEIPVGTLMIDLVDAKKKELGLARRRERHAQHDPNRTAEDRERKLRDVAAQMFAAIRRRSKPHLRENHDMKTITGSSSSPRGLRLRRRNLHRHRPRPRTPPAPHRTAPVTISYTALSTVAERDALFAALKAGGSAAAKKVLLGMKDIGTIEGPKKTVAVKYAFARPVGSAGW